MKISKLAKAQEYIINISKSYNKELYIATEIFDSLINRYLPSRAEIIDVTNIIKLNPAGIIITYGLILNSKIKLVKEIIDEIYKEQIFQIFKKQSNESGFLNNTNMVIFPKSFNENTLFRDITFHNYLKLLLKIYIF